LLKKAEICERHLRELDGRIRREHARAGKDAIASLENLRRQREDAEKDLKQVADELRRAAPRDADLRYPHPCTLEEAPAVLRPREVALHFVLGAEASYLILLEKEPVPGDKGEGLAVFPLPPAAEIEPRVAVLTDPDTLELPAVARAEAIALYRLLLEKSADR